MPDKTRGFRMNSAIKVYAWTNTRSNTQEISSTFGGSSKAAKRTRFNDIDPFSHVTENELVIYCTMAAINSRLRNEKGHKEWFDFQYFRTLNLKIHKVITNTSNVSKAGYVGTAG